MNKTGPLICLGSTASEEGQIKKSGPEIKKRGPEKKSRADFFC